MTEVNLADGRKLNFPDGTSVDVIQGTVKRLLGAPTQEAAQPEVLPEEAEIDRAPQTTEERFDLDPDVTRRGILFPTGIGKDGKTVFTPSEMMMEVMDAMAVIKRAREGESISQEEMLNTAAVMIGGPVRGMGKAAVRALGSETAETASRRARFEEQDIPATRGDLTQDFKQQATESRLAGLTDPDAEPLRQFRLEQSEAFTGKVNELVDSLGVPENTGQTVKDALSGRISLLRSEKNALYKEVADASPEVANTPILTDDIAAALPSAETLEDIAIVGANVDGIQKALVRFGINKDPAAINTFTEGGGTITPLTLGNFDRFRKVLGGLEKADQTGSAGVAIGPIRRALDEEALFVDDALKASGITDQGVINTLREARARVRTLKTEFSPQSIAGKLTDVKRDGVTPVIEASKVSNELLRPGAPIENLERTLNSLKRSPKGATAIGDLQSSVVMDALEAAFKAPSRKVTGVETVGGNQFAKALDKFGEDKLALLFKSNPEALKTLQGLKQTGLDITPASAAVPKGSAAVILDLIATRFGSLPGIAAFRDVARFAINAGSDERAVRKALDAAPPEIKRAFRAMNSRYPNIAAKLGILGATPEPLRLEDLDDTA